MAKWTATPLVMVTYTYCVITNVSPSLPVTGLLMCYILERVFNVAWRVMAVLLQNDYRSKMFGSISIFIWILYHIQLTQCSSNELPWF